MWIVPLALVAALSLQDELPAPQVPVLTADVGRFAPLDASEDKAVGIDLASIEPALDGRTAVDAYFLSEDPNVDPVAGVTYSRVLPSYMTKATLLVDCSERLVSVTRWSRLTDLGYSISEIPSSAEPITPQPLSPWGAVFHATCSVAEQRRLPVLDSYVLFYERMESMMVNTALRSMTRARLP